LEQLTTRQVEVLSEPPGARIEVNGNYIGDTPITTTLQCSPDGRFLEHTTIRALPQYRETMFSLSSSMAAFHIATSSTTPYPRGSFSICASVR
jgi:hypothetical protein